VTTAAAAERSAIATHGQLSVANGHVVDSSGEPLSLAGPSLFWGNKGWMQRAEFGPDEYYNKDVVAFVRREWNAPIIRISMGASTPGGYIEDPEGRWEKITAVADAAIAQGMYFIVDWHEHAAEKTTDEAVAFFRRVATQYGETGNIIYEIYNEPLNTTDWETVIKPYSKQVIAAIREIDPDNVIVVGTQTWSQDVDKAADSPIEGFENLAYALHFYAGTHKQDLRNKASYAMDKGLALMVTEWGSVNANGDGGPDLESTHEWMQFLRDNKLTHCYWSMHSKAEGASILAPGSKPDANWSDANFTASGKLIRDIIQGWHTHRYTAPD
jgi:endoglucanase